MQNKNLNNYWLAPIKNSLKKKRSSWFWIKLALLVGRGIAKLIELFLDWA